MTDHVFGKPLSRTLVAYENDIAIQISSLNSVSLYSTLADAQASVNPIVSMSSWTANGADPYQISYTLPALSDPAPNTDRKVWQFWESLSFELASNGEAQTDYRAIDVSRATTGESVPTTTISDLKALFPALASYLSDPRISDILTLAYTQMKLDLKSKGISYDKVRGLESTNLALAYLAISMSAEGLYSKTGQDVFLIRKDDYRKHYSDTLSKISFPNDSNGDGVVDELKQAQPTFWFVPR